MSSNKIFDKFNNMLFAVIIMSIMLPIILIQIYDDTNWMFNSTTSLWDAVDNGATLQTLIQVLLPISLVIGFVMMLIKMISLKMTGE